MAAPVVTAPVVAVPVVAAPVVAAPVVTAAVVAAAVAAPVVAAPVVAVPVVAAPVVAAPVVTAAVVAAAVAAWLECSYQHKVFIPVLVLAMPVLLQFIFQFLIALLMAESEVEFFSICHVVYLKTQFIHTLIVITTSNPVCYDDFIIISQCTLFSYIDHHGTDYIPFIQTQRNN